MFRETLVYTGQLLGASRLCFTNGAFSGYDSPQLATLVAFTAFTTLAFQVGRLDPIGVKNGVAVILSGGAPWKV